jgi:ubiquinone/menaquinone biosynthesis C-methylase UbiE
LSQSLERSEIEEVRIQQAYERRARAVPKNRYSTHNPGNQVIAQEIERALLSSIRLSYWPLQGKRILEVGCGTGTWLQNFIRWGAQPEKLNGIDLIAARIIEARRLIQKPVILIRGNAANLPFPDGTLDIVAQFTMFSSILAKGVKQKIAQEMLRVLKPNGCIVWYDFFVNNPWNPDVRGIGKREIQRLFPDCRTGFQRLTLLPPLARALGPISPRFCELLSKMKIFSTHYLAFIEKSVQP